jgi:hypothetical protein
VVVGRGLRPALKVLVSADAEISLEMCLNVGPLEQGGTAAFDVRNDSAALPVLNGTKRFVEAACQFAFGNESFLSRGWSGRGRWRPASRGCDLIQVIRRFFHIFA